MGPVQSILAAREKYERAIALLRNPARTSFVFVVQPEETPIAEAARASRELGHLGITTTAVIVNGILPPDECTNSFFVRRKEMQDWYLGMIEHEFSVPKLHMELLPTEIAGTAALAEVGERLQAQGIGEVIL